MRNAEVYRYDAETPCRIVYTRPDANVIVTSGHSDVSSSRPKLHRSVTTPVRSSFSIIEVEKSNKPTRAKSTTTVTGISNSSTAVESIATAVAGRTLTTMTDRLSTKSQRTSSRTGTLYFAFGADLSPRQFKSRGSPVFTSSCRPIALAKLRGWQWIISSRGVPNIVPLPELGVYNDRGRLRTREHEHDASVVYGLIYNLEGCDESGVDKRHGYEEHGPLNTDLDLVEAEKRPFLQGENMSNKRYERVEILEWFTDPLTEGVNVVRDATNVKCLVYVDESSKGLRPGRIWEDEVEDLSVGATAAVKKYGLPRRWIENVMGQHGVRILKSPEKTLKSRHRSRERRETRLEKMEYEGKKKYDCAIYTEDEDDDGTIIETLITKKVSGGLKSLPKSDFYREKKGKKKRYITTRHFA